MFVRDYKGVRTTSITEEAVGEFYMYISTHIFNIIDWDK